MSDLRTRMAALRARRAARAAESAKASLPKSVDPELLAAANAAGAPRPTWDKDYRERLAGTVESSDDEDEAIVVLPPPAVKLDPVASRVAWRKAQLAAAREQAAGFMRERFPAPAPLTQPKVVEEAPKEDVEDEEQLLVEEEGVESDEDEGEEEEVDGEEGEEEQEPGSVIDKADVEAEHVEVDTCDAETQPPRPEESSKNSFVSELVEEIFEKALISKATEVVGEQSKLMAHAEETSNMACSTKTDDSQRTAESSRATFKLAAESSSTVKSNAGQVANSGPAALASGTSASSNDKPGKKSATANSDRKAVTVTSGPVFGPFTKLGVSWSKTSRVASAFIDDEAEDEMDVDGDVPLAPDSDDDEENEVLGDDSLEPDTQQTEGDAQRLAEFHREWQKGTDIGAVLDTAKAVGCEQNVDNEMDLSELLQRKKEREAAEAEAGSENDDAASFCMGGHPNEVEDDIVDRYVDQMFRDENSRNEYHEEAEIATPEYRKKEARALWRARQRHQSGRLGKDPRAISLLTLFDDDDEEEEDNEAKFARLKSKLIRSSAAPNEKPDKRKQKNTVGVGEWQLRREAVTAMEKRRSAGFSLQDFMFKPDSAEQEPAQAKPAKRAPRLKESAAPPVGFEVFRPSARGVPIQARRRKRVQAGESPALERKKPRSSLFRTLGELPKSSS